MTVKEYLSQAYRIDQRINSKLEQVASLRALATKATSTLSDTPPSGSRNVQSMAASTLTSSCVAVVLSSAFAAFNADSTVLKSL